MILVDPKRVELGIYEGIPHLLHADHHRAQAGGQRAAQRGARNGAPVEAAGRAGRPQHRPVQQAVRRQSSRAACSKSDAGRAAAYIVIIIDELADLMMLDGRTWKSRSRAWRRWRAPSAFTWCWRRSGRSVDVITGLIKANFPARISFRVATKVDSRTILDANGAEALLGRGDMLYLPSGSSRCIACTRLTSTEKEIARSSSSGSRRVRRSISKPSSKLRKMRMADPKAEIWATRTTTTNSSRMQ